MRRSPTRAVSIRAHLVGGLLVTLSAACHAAAPPARVATPALGAGDAARAERVLTHTRCALGLGLGLGTADGADGARGAHGADGLDGVGGARGADGADGLDGVHGADGAHGAAAWCAFGPGARPVRVATMARAVVPRIGGGAFALLADGRLLRFDRAGALSGTTPSPLTSLASAGPWACGLLPGGIGCFRDRHEDLTCPSAPFAPALALFDAPDARAVNGRLAVPALEVTELPGITRVYRLSMPCEEHCVALGCTGELACADWCAAGEAPRLSLDPVASSRAGEHFFKPMAGSGDSPVVAVRTRAVRTRVEAVTPERRAPELTVLEGGAVSLDDVARRELPRVERLLVRILGPRADLEDLVQNVFLELCRALPRYRGEAELSTFVGGITVRVARRAMRRGAFFRRRGPMPEEPVSTSSSPEDDADARRALAVVRAALERLSAKKRIAFSLWAFEGMDVAEIAAMMEASVAATRSRIWYAQRELRARAERDPALRAALGEG